MVGQMPTGLVLCDYVVPMNFHDLHMTSITGEDVDFGGFRDQMALVVNVASK